MTRARDLADFLTALAPAPNRLPYFDEAGNPAQTLLTPNARTLLGSDLIVVSGDNLVTGTGARLTGGMVTQSATDTTAGRLLKVGDSATLLSASPALRVTRGGSANAITLTTGAGISGTPPTGLQLRFRATPSNTGATTIALDGGSAIACRTISGVALPSGYIRTDADTVAIYDGTFWVLDRQIERGSNANGEFVRFADGTQICAHMISLGSRLAFGAGTAADPYRTALSTWTFPAVFAAAPSPTGSTSTTTSTGPARPHVVSFGTISASQVTNVQACAISTNSTDIEVFGHVFAISRWF